jgi:D-alanyl-D-alanine carboxypeptidase/D-alanyl-D-alanine-endopeptidase (penicillin-binding protein 4)
LAHLRSFKDCYLLLLLAAFSQAETLEQKLDRLMEAGPGKYFAGVEVFSLESKKVLFKYNDEYLFMPASNMKVLTTALAMLRLGPDYHFTTRLLRESSGDLVLAGSGDPSLSGRVYPYAKDSGSGPPLRALEVLADRAVAAGLTRVDGDVVGDDRLYPYAPYPPSWTQDDIFRDYGAPVSALTLNDNNITIIIQPGAEPGDPAQISLSPALEYYAIDNRILTVPKGGEARIRISKVQNARQLLMWGSIPAGHAAFGETLSVDDPALFAAQALYDALARRGVTIAGKAVARHRSVNDDYDPVPSLELASRVSPPLVQLLQVTDKTSQNLHAELMLREVGRATRFMGTRESGLDEMTAMFKEAGASAGDARLEDGSGLARNVMVAPRLMTRILAHLYASKYREAFISLFPIGGEDGTLKNRMKDKEGADEIHAKTGTLSRAIALSGYVQNKTRGWLAFSIIVNSFTAPPSDVRKWIDKIALELTE